ncbi:universal stress protein (plasmid) [Tistrella bauzanensis]|uniref:universal stress protein n=1 Tax=Tistrella TaxID=171436 RepID=UPI0031F6DA0E
MPPAPPAAPNILLATDITGRTDRALDRAVALARQTGGRLTILHVAEADSGAEGSAEEQMRAAAARLAADLPAGLLDGAAAQGFSITTRIEEGVPADVIADLADREGNDVIVTGLARAEPHGLLLLGDTVDRLLRRAPAPVLVVRRRVTGPYQHLMIATDFSKPARHAVEAALALFATARITVVHAHDPAEADEAGPALDRFIDGLAIAAPLRDRMARITAPGTPATVLPDQATALDADLVAIGTRGHGILAEAVMGSAARQVLAAIDCDALVVPARGR